MNYSKKLRRTLRSNEPPVIEWRSPFDLVILDMLLNEDEDGLHVFEAIRQLFPQQKVIIASGHAPTERAEQAIGQGLIWLQKPYTSDALSKAVRNALTETAQ